MPPRLKTIPERIASVYLRELPRLLREHRWPLLLLLLLFLAGCVFGLHSAQTANSEQTAGFVERATSTQWYDWMVPFPSCRLCEQGWLSFFVPNTVRGVLAFFWGAISFGLLALWIVWSNGSYVGWVIVGSAPLAHQASGVGVAGTAGGVLLPHGLLEYPAFLLAWALALRAGFVWIRPLPGLRRWPSVKRLFGDFRISLLAIVPLLLVAALLETYVNPFFVDRYMVGIGKAPAMIGERRVGRHFSVDQCAWSPDGDHIVFVDLAGRVWLRELSDDQPAVLLADPGDDFSFVSPSWCPNGRRIALVRDPTDLERIQDHELAVLDIDSQRVHSVRGGPVGRYLSTAWAPSGDMVGIAVSEFSGEQNKGSNIWTVDLEAGTWDKATTFLAGWPCVAPGSGLSWRADGRAIAFVKLAVGQRQRDTRSAAARRYALCVVSTDGTELREVTGLRHTTDVAWSPDGNWIAFSDLASDVATEVPPDSDGWEDQDILDIGLVRPDGSDRTDGLARIDPYSSLSWSPDGTELAYQRLSTCIIGAPRVLASE